MHGKKVYINKSMYSIQGLKTVSNSLPKGLKKIFKKGGHNYNSIIENWSNLVGKKISNICYPKSVKTNKELKDGVLILNVFQTYFNCFTWFILSFPSYKSCRKV